MILGTALLAVRTHALPSETVSVVSEIAKAVFGGGFMFWLIQISTFAILILAANTSFQGFPRLAALLARDRYHPSPVREPRRPPRVFERHAGARCLRHPAHLGLPRQRPEAAAAVRGGRLHRVHAQPDWHGSLLEAGRPRGGPRAEGWRWRLADQRRGRRRDRHRAGHRRLHEVRGGRVDRDPAIPDPHRRLLRGPPSLRERLAPASAWRGDRRRHRAQHGGRCGGGAERGHRRGDRLRALIPLQRLSRRDGLGGLGVDRRRLAPFLR